MPARYEFAPLELDKELDKQIGEFDYTKSPEYSEATEKVEISEVNRRWGIETNIIYELKFKRPTPHLVDFSNERAVFFDGWNEIKRQENPPIVKSEKEATKLGAITVEAITLEDLATEPVSDEIMFVEKVFGDVEKHLPDFSKDLVDAFKEVMGISRSSNQWMPEEAVHADLLDLMRMSQGKLLQEDRYKGYYDVQGDRWMRPFDTPLKNIAYAYLQERNTKENYMALSRKMREQGAVKHAYIAAKIGADESYHGAGYHDYLEAYARLGPQQALEAATAVLEVAWNFRMPALHFMDNRLRDTSAIVDTIDYNREGIEKMLRQALNALSFIPKEFIDPLVDNYWDAEAKRTKILMRKQHKEKYREDKAAGNGSNGRENGDSNEDDLIASEGTIFASDGNKHAVPVNPEG